MEDKQSRILEGSIFKNLLIFTIPIILTGVLQLLYNAADIVIVGRFVGSDSLAAVGSTAAVINLMINMFIGLSGGTSVCVAQFAGAKQKSDLERTVHTSLSIAVIGGIFLAIVGYIFSKPILSLMKTPENILDEATLYMQIIFLGMPANLVYNFGAAILRANGDTKTPLIFLTIAGMVNVILNVFFVVFFNMKADGVGWATIISQAISAILVVGYLIKSNDDIKFKFKKIAIHKNIMIRILKIGVPAGIQGMLFSISNIIIQSSINSFGSIVVAGNSSANNLEGFTYTAMNSMHQSVVTYVGQHMGARKFERIKKIIITGCVQVTLIGAFLGVLSLIFAHPLLDLYTPGNEEAISSGINRLTVILSTYFLCGIMDVLVAATRGMGESLKPMVVSILGVCVIRIVWIYTVFAIFKTPFVLYISYPVTWFITAVLQGVICKKTLKEILVDFT